ncbi:FadR/GntR family transcriptional regulator [Pseudarthrobacter sp. SSS035]|uniref:FadR/GntR family transcriptional regulator n=1 Tax=Pseudarthrobacter sp. SSS035 TaxID=2931399 RepID=UPI00200F2741|nr:FCD domain-containing protein [Pseudarthrobacter sp. SSS035]
MSVVSRRTLTDQVSEALLKIIVDDEMSTGDPLPPAGELAKRFDVSTVVIREAVAQLAGRGALSRRQGREPVVALPGADILAEILTMHGRQENIPPSDFLVCRAALELESAALAALNLGEHSRALALEPALATLRGAKRREAIVEADLALHLAIAELSGNRALKVILMSLVDVIATEITRRTPEENEEYRCASLRDHEAIVTAIVSGDAAAARRSMAAHFDAAMPGYANGSH